MAIQNVSKKDGTTADRVDDDDDDDLAPGCDLQTVFLLESSSDGARYVDVFRQAVDDAQRSSETVDGCCNVIVVDRERLVGPMRYDDGGGGDPPATALTVPLVRRAVAAAVRAWHTERPGADGDGGTGTDENGRRPAVSVVLTGFFHLPFVAEFVGRTGTVDAVIELRCGLYIHVLGLLDGFEVFFFLKL